MIVRKPDAGTKTISAGSGPPDGHFQWVEDEVHEG
jgi:hypothetical protein